jgi:serine/threonine-protein kinase
MPSTNPRLARLWRVPWAEACALALLVGTSALADGRDQALEADALFEKARALLKAGHAEDACPLLEKSHKLDPALGTLLNLADCNERIGKLASAYLLFNEAKAWADRTREHVRSAAAAEHLAALRSRLSWLALSADDPPPALTVRVNEATIALGPTAQSVPVDSGEITVIATCDGYERFTSTLRVGTAQTVAVVIPHLRSMGATAAGAARAESLPRATGAVQPPTAVPPRALEVERSRSSSGPVSAIAGGAVASVSAVIGLGWSFATYQRLAAQQPGQINASSPTVTRGDFDALRVVYPVSWVAAVVGVAALVAGTIWWLWGTSL